MDYGGLRIYVADDRITVTNSRVHIAFDRHWQDEDNSASIRCISGTDIPRLFDAINTIGTLSTLPPGNEHIAQRHSGEYEAVKPDNNADNAEEKPAGNGRERAKSRA